MFEKIKVTEYDIKQANINVLYLAEAIDKKTYNILKNTDKKTRVIKIGKMMRDNKKIYDIYINRLKKYIKTFIKDNDLENNIYEIVKDAVWVYDGKYPKKREYSKYIKFVPKRSATSVFTIPHRNIKFYFNSVYGIFFQRGLGDIKKNKYPILGYIKKFMALKENNDYKNLYVQLHEYSLQYLRKEVNKKHRRSLISKKLQNGDDTKEDDNYVKIIIPMINSFL